MNQHLSTSFVARTMRARGYDVREGRDVRVTGGAADSRKVVAGDLFTAFPGENSDGNVFVAEALANGAVAAICERAPAGDWAEQTIVIAPDATRAVGELAHAWRRECGTPVVGITGTVGKTTAKELTAAALARRLRTHKSGGNFNSREGLPLAVMSLTRDHEVSVLEMGMDSVGEISYLCDIAEPRVGVVLNIGLTHISKLGSIEAIEREKLSLPRWLAADGTAVLNMDDTRIAAVVPELKCRVIGFGVDTDTDLVARNVSEAGLSGTTFDAHFEGESASVHSPLAGVHLVPAALAAIGVCCAMGMSLADAAQAVSEAPFEGRAQVLVNPRGVQIIDDRYNASPASLAGALRMLATLPGRRIAFIGRMAELGEFEAEEHRAIGRVAAESADILVTFGPVCIGLADEARAAGLQDVRWFETKEAAAADVTREMRAGDVVLVKGSR
ncbi:MAG: UDP-N-acetylmuramoyl-tripeptide--D-alanyl-D-alanine ligase, partial [Tepidiformaceae bacterium]